MSLHEHDIDHFTNFAKARLQNGDTDLSLSQLVDEFTTAYPPQEDLPAIQAALQGMEQGDTGHPFAEFADDMESFRKFLQRRQVQPTKSLEERVAEFRVYQAEVKELHDRLQRSQRSGPAVPLDHAALIHEIEQEIRQGDTN